MMNNNISLIAQMGSGKTTIGEILADKLGYNFVDTDEEIEKLYGSIPHLFETIGVLGFRKLEYEIISNYIKQEGKKVISTGGGAITYSANFSLLKEETFMIYLKTSPQIIFERIKNDTKRLYRNAYSLEFTEEIFEQRQFLYQKANLIIENNEYPEMCVEKILHGLSLTST